MYFETIQQFNKTLGQVETWLRAAMTYAAAKPFDPEILLVARLAPDQFALARQVQIACDTAKLAAARLTGKEGPAYPDTERTLDELCTRIQGTRSFLDSLVPGDFEGAATRVITQPRWEGKVMSGADYFMEHALPNFFFHASHSYAILRHNGVPLGKKNFLGTLSQHLP